LEFEVYLISNIIYENFYISHTINML